MLDRSHDDELNPYNESYDQVKYKIEYYFYYFIIVAGEKVGAIAINDKNAQKIKYNLSGNAQYWWLRSIHIALGHNFFIVTSRGNSSGTYADTILGVAPAFRIGK